MIKISHFEKGKNKGIFITMDKTSALKLCQSILGQICTPDKVWEGNRVEFIDAEYHSPRGKVKPGYYLSVKAHNRDIIQQ